MRTCVIFNPAAKGEKARRFARHLGAIAAQCTLKKTAGAGDARQLASDAVREGFEIVAAAGGDGTINEVLNGMADVPGGLERARLGVLPLGTVNVFARELGIPRQFEAAWRTLLEARETRIDLPEVEYHSGGAVQRRCFAQLAGAGLDARAIALVHWPLKKRVGAAAYLVAGCHALLKPASPITVCAGARTERGELVLVGNGRLYGGNFSVFPKADLKDGMFDICVFPRANWLTLARCGPALLLRRRLPGAALVQFQTAAFSLSSDPPAPLEVDGEWVGQVPAWFSMHCRGLGVIVP